MFTKENSITANSKPEVLYDICVLGLGYIGLPTASIFATKGKKVLGVDVVSYVVNTVNNGRIHIDEPDLDVLVKAAVQSGNLRAAEKPEAASVFIIAVPTPFTVSSDSSKIPDLTYVEMAARSLAPVVKAGDLIILESTSPVGTTAKIRDWIYDELIQRGRFDSQRLVHGAVGDVASLGSPISSDDGARTASDTIPLLFAHCPERILPGQMLKELVSNDRIVGGLTVEAAEASRELYRTFCMGEIFLTDARTAEMAKLTENSFRDVNIAFANELSLICERLDIDVWDLIRLANRHPRVKILQPGPGVGGHCIAVDPWFIVAAAPEEARLIRTAREVNDSKPHHIVSRISAAAAAAHDPVIACLGLSFKADVDDMRESPAVEIVKLLVEHKVGRLLTVEPHARNLPRELSGLPVELVTLPAAIAAATIVVLLVNHREFVSMDRAALTGKTVIDTRGIWR